MWLLATIHVGSGNQTRHQMFLMLIHLSSLQLRVIFVVLRAKIGRGLSLNYGLTIVG